MSSAPQRAWTNADELVIGYDPEPQPAEHITVYSSMTDLRLVQLASPMAEALMDMRQAGLIQDNTEYAQLADQLIELAKESHA
jgi:hypothetical protein